MSQTDYAARDGVDQIEISSPCTVSWDGMRPAGGDGRVRFCGQCRQNVYNVEATSRAELVGQMGVVISSKVDAEFGEVRVKDKTGHDLRVICKLAAGVREPKEHEEVVFVEYDDAKGLLVSPMDRIDLPPDGGDDDEHEQHEEKSVRRAG